MKYINGILNTRDLNLKGDGSLESIIEEYLKHIQKSQNGLLKDYQWDRSRQKLVDSSLQVHSSKTTTSSQSSVVARALSSCLERAGTPLIRPSHRGRAASIVSGLSSYSLVSTSVGSISTVTFDEHIEHLPSLTEALHRSRRHLWLQIYTGNPPFAHIRKEAATINEVLTKGNQPEMSSEMSVGLLWELVQQCLLSSASDRLASEDLMRHLEAYNLGESVDKWYHVTDKA
ncbi:hypothetical protein EV421DRAFT_1743741 [Armillaria borealis]|uniref:Uncharacterized protein n=1 Tax=Armillaria borealis TaxID=47425 RepID=A0AA39IX03_9AGAR|nr:hypothetical protein EV421DRAFT_1743741 [Armillaria borealis]